VRSLPDPTLRKEKKGGDEVRPDAQLFIKPFLKTVARACHALLLLDYDGTLAPLRPERAQALPYPGVTSILQQIVRDGHTRVVIVSGRDTSEIIPLLSVQPYPEVWGVHGLQRQRPDGCKETMLIEERVLDALVDAGHWLDYQQVRQTAEFKTGSIAVHWRGLSTTDAEELRGRVLLGWKPIARLAGLELLEFDGGIEIRTREADKGYVVQRLLGEMDAGTPAAYLGDDTTDEGAFRAIQGRGFSVLVRPRWRQSAAQLWLRPPDELLEFLEQWLASCRKVVRGGETAVAGRR
jgi:trehalose 6-phosphate phosphatase